MKCVYLVFAGLLIFSTSSFAKQSAGLPACTVKMFDEFNMPISQVEWTDEFYTGMIIGNSLGILVTASLGNNQLMSLWIRDKRPQHPNGMFTFMDFASGREQRHSLYLANGYHIEASCKWIVNTK